MARAAALVASCLVVSDAAVAAGPGRLCFDMGLGDTLELGVPRSELAKPGYGSVTGRTFRSRGRGECPGPTPLPISGSYSTSESGHVIVSLVQVVLIDVEGCGGVNIYTLALSAPKLKGDFCLSSPGSDATGCTTVEPVACPRPR